MVEIGEGLFGERGELLVPAAGNLLESRLGGAGLAHFNIGDAGEVKGVFALLGHAIVVGDVDELRVGGLSTLFCGGVGLDAGVGGLAGDGEGRLVGLHRRTEGHGSEVGAVIGVGDDRNCNDDDSEDQRDSHDDRLAVIAGPLEAVLGCVDELVVLELFLGELIHGVGFPSGA